MEFSDPLVLELVPDGDHVKPVLVTKCPPGVAAFADSLNQRGLELYSEITVWPTRQHWRHSTGGTLVVASSEHKSWSIRFWYQEAYIYAKECRDALLHAVDTLSFGRPFPRPKKGYNDAEPREEDFGKEWSDELEVMKLKRDGWK